MRAVSPRIRIVVYFAKALASCAGCEARTAAAHYVAWAAAKTAAVPTPSAAALEQPAAKIRSARADALPWLVEAVGAASERAAERAAE